MSLPLHWNAGSASAGFLAISACYVLYADSCLGFFHHHHRCTHVLSCGRMGYLGSACSASLFSALGAIPAAYATAGFSTAPHWCLMPRFLVSCCGMPVLNNTRCLLPGVMLTASSRPAVCSHASVCTVLGRDTLHFPLLHHCSLTAYTTLPGILTLSCASTLDEHTLFLSTGCDSPAKADATCLPQTLHHHLGDLPGLSGSCDGGLEPRSLGTCLPRYHHIPRCITTFHTFLLQCVYV